MTMQLTLNADGTVSTLALLAEINGARASANEPEVLNAHFLTRVMDELDLTEDSLKVLNNGGAGRKPRYFDLTEDQAKQVAMRESKAVRKWVVAELNRLYAKADEAPKSLADMLEEAAALIRQKDQKIRDRALRGVMCTPKLVKKHPARLPVH